MQEGSFLSTAIPLSLALCWAPGHHQNGDIHRPRFLLLLKRLLRAGCAARARHGHFEIAPGGPYPIPQLTTEREKAAPGDKTKRGANLHVQDLLEGFCVAVRQEFDVVVHKHHQRLVRGHHDLPRERGESRPAGNTRDRRPGIIFPHLQADHKTDSARSP